MSETTGFRRAMAWIHGWLGLLAGWILFAIFLTGTASYFRQEITRWMQPERPDAVVSMADAATATVRHLAATSRNDDRWTIFLPTDRTRETKVFVRPQGTGKRAPRLDLDPATGEPVHARATQGGELLFEFHYALQLPKPWGEWIAGTCAMAMLAAIISGVITHKRIFADFFTMRWGKGQRSWLDAHNLVAVMGLPYHLVITYSGLFTLATLYMPWPVLTNYPKVAAYSAAIFSEDVDTKRTGRPAPLVPIGPVVRDAEARLGVAASSVAIRFPGDASAVISVAGRTGSGLAARGGSVSYSGASGRVLALSKSQSPGVATGATIFGLHLGYFADTTMRWMLFLLGLSGTAMVGSGLILWSAKRKRDPRTSGHALVHRMNLAVITCLPAGIAAYFLANRLIPAWSTWRAQGEEWALFGTWATLALGSCIRPLRAAWIETAMLVALLYAAVPVADLALVGAPRDALFWSFDAVMLLTAGVAAAAAARLSRPVTPRLRIRAVREVVVHVVD